MFPFWKDLLFLHEHLLRKENLAWRPDLPTKPAPGKRARKTQRVAVTCCATAWPRIMRPR